ncbi:hypothetical protein Tco_1167939, partial [Tanacetum coccineum]
MMDIIKESVFVPVNKELIPIRVYEIDKDVSLLLNGYLMDSSSDEEDSIKGESCNNENDDEEGNNDDLRDGNKENEDGNQHVETYGGESCVGTDSNDSDNHPNMENVCGHNLCELKACPLYCMGIRSKRQVNLSLSLTLQIY